MKKLFKIFIVLCVCFSVCSCKSKEQKALKLIDQKMFSTLYDYDSYQPVETKIDSAFYLPEYNDTIIALALLANDCQQKMEDELDKGNSSITTMTIWGGSYSSYGRSRFLEAKEEGLKHLEKSKEYGALQFVHLTSLREKSKHFDGSFYGWKVTHKFRCKTKGGYSALSTYIYIFDKKMKTILYQEDSEDNDTIKAKETVRTYTTMGEDDFIRYVKYFSE